MIWIVLLVALFVCILSIFVPELRNVAKGIITTAVVVGLGIFVLFELATHGF